MSNDTLRACEIITSADAFLEDGESWTQHHLLDHDTGKVCLHGALSAVGIQHGLVTEAKVERYSYVTHEYSYDESEPMPFYINEELLTGRLELNEDGESGLPMQMTVDTTKVQPYLNAAKYVERGIGAVLAAAPSHKWRNLRFNQHWIGWNEEECRDEYDTSPRAVKDYTTDIVTFNDHSDTTYEDIREALRIARMICYAEAVFGLRK